MKPPEGVELSQAVDAWLRAAESTPRLREKFKKAKKAIKNMREVGPHYPAFETHAMNHLKGPGGATIWNSYV